MPWIHWASRCQKSEWLRERGLVQRALRTVRAGCADAALIRVAAGAPPGHSFLGKYALYCGGRRPLGVYEGRFAIF